MTGTTTVVVIGNDSMITRPRWRTRSTGVARRNAVAVTFAILVVLGLLIMLAVMWALAALGAPATVRVLVWLVPTLVTTAWVVRSDRPAVATDDDEEGWTIYTIRYALVGNGAPRDRIVRVIPAVIFGGPIAWVAVALGALALTGLWEF